MIIPIIVITIGALFLIFTELGQWLTILFGLLFFGATFFYSLDELACPEGNYYEWNRENGTCVYPTD